MKAAESINIGNPLVRGYENLERQRNRDREREREREREKEREFKAISHLFTRPPGTDVLARVPPRVCTGSRAGYRLDKYKQSLNNASAVPALGSKQVT